MEIKKVSDGNIKIEEKTFYYEFWSDNREVTIKIFHNGKNGKSTEFNRNDSLNLKREMMDALISDGVI